MEILIPCTVNFSIAELFLITTGKHLHRNSISLIFSRKFCYSVQ